MEININECRKIRNEILQIENKEKIAFINQNPNRWFEQDDFFIKPLVIEEENIRIVRVGQYEGNLYIEFEDIVVYNFSIENSICTSLPENIIKAILEIIMKTLNYIPSDDLKTILNKDYRL